MAPRASLALASTSASAASRLALSLSSSADSRVTRIDNAACIAAAAVGASGPAPEGASDTDASKPECAASEASDAATASMCPADDGARGAGLAIVLPNAAANRLVALDAAAFGCCCCCLLRTAGFVVACPTVNASRGRRGAGDVDNGTLVGATPAALAPDAATALCATSAPAAAADDATAPTTVARGSPITTTQHVAPAPPTLPCPAPPSPGTTAGAPSGAPTTSGLAAATARAALTAADSAPQPTPERTCASPAVRGLQPLGPSTAPSPSAPLGVLGASPSLPLLDKFFRGSSPPPGAVPVDAAGATGAVAGSAEATAPSPPPSGPPSPPITGPPSPSTLRSPPDPPSVVSPPPPPALPAGPPPPASSPPSTSAPSGRRPHACLITMAATSRTMWLSIRMATSAGAAASVASTCSVSSFMFTGDSST